MPGTNSVAIDFAKFDEVVGEIKLLGARAVAEGLPMHSTEEMVFKELLKLGHALQLAIFQSLGNGDVGPELEHADHPHPLKRFPELSTRSYRSVFGDFKLSRYVYGRTVTQKAYAIPFDEHFGLPPESFSLMLEGWVSQLAASEPIHEAMEKLNRLFGIAIANDSSHRILDRVAANAEFFQDNLPAVEVAEEGELLIESTDNKGIVMRRPASLEKLPVGAPSGRTGPIPDRKQMATVCGCYSVDRYVRTPDEVLKALFRERKETDEPDHRPRPKQSRYQACLTRTQEQPDDTLVGEVTAIGWLCDHVQERRRKGQVLLNLNDGEISIWDNLDLLQAETERVDILDLMHALSRIWEAAAILKPDNVTEFAKEHIYLILCGDVKRVIQKFRYRATAMKLAGKDAKTIRTICGFFERNSHRMQYDKYLAQGYPIATGFIEGACRHLVKDRMERSGMRWTVAGAQDMLYLRCIDAANLWKDFLPVHQARVLAMYGERKNYFNSFQLAA